jgi:hypothetical protein
MKKKIQKIALGHVVKCVKNNQILAICSITQAHSACIRYVDAQSYQLFVKSAYRDAADLGSISVSMSSKVEIHNIPILMNQNKSVLRLTKNILCDFCDLGFIFNLCFSSTYIKRMLMVIFLVTALFVYIFD